MVARPFMHGFPSVPLCLLLLVCVTLWDNLYARADLEWHGSFISDDPSDYLRHSQLDEDTDQIDRLTRWPGNKIVVPAVYQSYSIRPAAFGPDKVDEDGLWGTLWPIQRFLSKNQVDIHGNTGCPGIPSDEDGMEIESSKHKPPSDWIALMERGGCSFDAKVRFAQSLGAKAVIMGDSLHRFDEESVDPVLESVGLADWDDSTDDYSSLPTTMLPHGDTSDIVIPSCFVIRSSYLELLEFTNQARQGLLPDPDRNALRVGLFLDASVLDTPWLDLGLLFCLIPSLCILFVVISHHVRLWVQQFRERASVEAVRSLPCYEWHADGKWERIPREAVPYREALTFMLRLMQGWDAMWERISSFWGGRQAETESLINNSRPIRYDDVAMRDTQTEAHIDSSIPPNPQAMSRYNQVECAICLLEFAEGYATLP